ncbi:MAG: class I SAM-dependent methyltransferase [Actinomycetota bacterium]|nr:class I SAM-dependent methyltransferase [Actinomycetota bacterium]
MVEELRERGARAVLDVGSGLGRHALHFARAGLFTALPFAAGAFDYVLAWNVLYHGDAEAVRATRSARICSLSRETRATRRIRTST